MPLFLFPGRLSVQPDLAQLCENVSQPGKLKSLKFKKLGAATITVDADAYLTRTINPITKATFTILTCENSSPESCQHFQTWRFGKETCNLMKRTDVFWSPIFNNVEPQLNCPAPPGEYRLRNGTLDMSSLQHVPFPLEKYYWRGRLEGFDPDLALCVEVGANFIRSLL